ncbi:MAG: hypothetical protein FJ206_11760 [Gemmatimonadetes bacterium]|nr:hypothetical protein [Gemmatimonadota bacterium]
MTSPDNSKPTIDRAALDRIIQRAAELQTGDRDLGDHLTADEVLALGKDVGIPAKYLQQAMLEHRTAVEPPADAGVLARLVGPGEVRAQRVVQGDPDDAVRSLLHWMERNELLVVRRQQAGWVSWEPLKGMQAAIRRGTAALDTSKPKFMLSRAEVVTATAAALETGYTHVTLSATLRATRRDHLIGASVAGGVGVAGTGVLATLGLGLLAALPVAFGGLIAAVVLKNYRPIGDRVQLGLERALDYLERGGVKPGHEQLSRGPGLIELLTTEVRRAISTVAEGKQESRRQLPDGSKSGPR